MTDTNGPARATRSHLTPNTRPPLHPEGTLKKSPNPRSPAMQRASKNDRKPGNRKPGNRWPSKESLGATDGDDSDSLPEEEEDNEEDMLDNEERENKRGRTRVLKRKTSLKDSPKGRKAATDTPKDERKVEETQLSVGWSIAILIVAIAILVGCIYLYSGLIETGSDGDTTTATPKIDYFKQFKDAFEREKRLFPSQSSRFWKVIGTPIKRVLNDPPKYPAVILLTVPGDVENVKVASCLVKHLSQEVNTVFEINTEPYVDVASLNKTSPAKTKLHLDEKMVSILTSGRSLIIDNIEGLPAEAALLLHGYCDGDNAPYKSAVIFLVLHVPHSSQEITEFAVEKHLSKLWAGLGADEVPALLSRIANNQAVFTPEPGNKHHAICGI